MQNLTNQYGKLFYIIHDIKFKGNLHFFKIRQKKKEKKRWHQKPFVFNLKSWLTLRVLCGRSLLFERNRKYNSGILRNITNATLASKRASTSNHIQRCTGIYSANMDVLHILSVLVLLTVVSVDSLMFHLAANQKKCLKEEIHKDVLVTGEYQLSDVPGHKTQLLVQTTVFVYGIICVNLYINEVRSVCFVRYNIDQRPFVHVLYQMLSFLLGLWHIVNCNNAFVDFVPVHQL